MKKLNIKLITKPRKNGLIISVNGKEIPILKPRNVDISEVVNLEIQNHDVIPHDLTINGNSINIKPGQSFKHTKEALDFFLETLEVANKKIGPAGKDGISLQGELGPRGPKGEKGDSGQDGKDGVDGKDGKDGIDGKDGATGLTGKDGKDGIDGKDGKDGAVGPKGDKGEDGSKGEKGEDGPPGIQGDNGVQGEKGEAGSSIVWKGSWEVIKVYVKNDVVEHEGSTYIALAENISDQPVKSSKWDLMAQRGFDGRGSKGATGDTGATGPQGPAGSGSSGGSRAAWGGWR